MSESQIDEPVPEDDSEIPELSTEPDNPPVDAPLPEVEDLDQDPEGIEIPEQNKHEE
jgi:hypothetical protein